MTGTRRLSELFQVKSRFYRSVNIVADYDDPDAITEYILSPLGRSVLRRIGDGLKSSSRGRAWSIVGPYGAGKSAFAVFLARVLGYPKDVDARERLRAVDATLHSELHRQLPALRESGFSVVPIVGSREPLALAVLRGLATSLSSGPLAGDCEELLQWLRSLSQQLEEGESLAASVLLEAVEKASRAVREKSLGLLLILDELGKLLEYAALKPAQGDIFLLQSMAELASRSNDEPFGLIVILHQSFERYAARLSPSQQREWAKVQGRFEDIGFLESPGELLRLLGEAIQPLGSLDGLGQVIAQEVEQAKDLDLAPRELSWRDAEVALGRCAPLHPTVSLVLGRLFRSRLAQNERSLFAFLTSGEPHGFQDYVKREWWGDGRYPFYRLDQLYDYVLTAMGSALYSLSQGKKWAEIEDALERLPKDATALDARLVKIIGMLGLLGDQRYLKASEKVLTYAVVDSPLHGADSVPTAIQRLCKQGVAIYRQHKDAYSLWEGSDIDLEERFQQGLDHVDKSISLSALLQDSDQLRPYLAKRHLFETGTLRYFAPWVVDLDHIRSVCDRPLGTADGALIFVVGDNGDSVAQAIETVAQVSSGLPSPRRELLLFAIPLDTHALRQAVEEVIAWDWVAKNTSELEGDSIARKELAGRQIEAEGRLEQLCSVCFEKTSSHAAWVWIHAGAQREFRTAAELSSTLSAICDRVYSAAPVVRNELVNRRSLSSAAVAARGSLISRMLTHTHEPRLGIVGFPPELSMYRSVLEASGLHHQSGPRWEFGPSDSQDPGRVTGLWQGIDGFLSSTENRKRPVGELFEILRQPPYGIKDGLLPIYLAVAILHWEAEIALYENGAFIPKPDLAVFERLIKVPERFHIQRYSLGEARSYLFQQYAALLGREQTPSDRTTLVSAVRPILAFVRQLPPYTHLTDAVSPQAIAVRAAVLSAQEPHTLLFEALPLAVGVDAGQVNADPETAQAFFAVLREALLELQRAYDGLLAAIQEELLEAMRLPRAITAARREATQRAMILREHVADLRLKAFVLRLADVRLPEQEWVESVAACLANKPPKQWADADRLRYQTELSEMAARFRRVEEIAVDVEGIGEHMEGATLMRLGVTLPSGEERREIVRVLPEEAADVRAVADALEAALQQSQTSARTHMAAIAELARRVWNSSRAIDRGDA